MLLAKGTTVEGHLHRSLVSEAPGRRTLAEAAWHLRICVSHLALGLLAEESPKYVPASRKLDFSISRSSYAKIQVSCSLFFTKHGKTGLTPKEGQDRMGL